MATAIQIAVAAALVVAWVWVLGRPLVKGLLQLLGGSEPAPMDRAHDDEDAFWGAPRFNWFGWAEKPRVVRRRQLLLATVFACFGSFLLAVALRGRFVYLFALMVLVLAGHLAVASHLGGRMIRAREQTRRDAARRQAGVGGDVTVRATRIRAEIDGDHALIRAEELLARYPLVDPDGSYQEYQEYHSPLAGGERAVSSLVEELIELEWGSSDPVPEPVPESAAAPEPAMAATAAPPSDAELLAGMLLDDDRVPTYDAASPGSGAGPAPVDGSGLPGIDREATAEAIDAAASPVPVIEPAALVEGAEPAELVEPVVDPGPGVAPTAETEPIFTRPAAQAPARPRRKARPIYIHSHLDEEGFEPPRAVNHP